MGRGAEIKSFAALTITTSTRPEHSLAGELKSLLPARFLEKIPYPRLPHLPRYLKALLLRVERSQANPRRDAERAAQIVPYRREWERLHASTLVRDSEKGRELIEELRWLIEEFKVSLFAQELGTAVPVSPKRLDQHLARIREEIGEL